MRTHLFVLLLFAASLGVFFSYHSQGEENGFVPPDASQRKAAVGSLTKLPREQRRAFSPDDNAFVAIPSPGRSDWLANHQEVGQTFAQFRRGHPNKPDEKRNTLYLQPLNQFGDTAPNLNEIADYSSAFFGMPTKILPTIQSEKLPFTQRTNEGMKQWLSTDILRWLEARIPNDAYCLLAVTMVDLFPDPDWNYVFGQASLKNRVGVYSFARYDPTFWGNTPNTDSDRLMLRRSCKVLTHETGHMFGIKHCVHFHCVMNGSNHLKEADAHPIHLCPVCLRKLHDSVGFRLSNRYKRLLALSEEFDWDDEVIWLRGRITKMERQ